MIEIKEVKTKKQIKEFIEFPLNLYKDNEFFVPPLYGDEKAMFKPSYNYYDQAEAVFYNAYKNGEIVGRIQGILQFASNKKWNQKRVRFTRFDSINDQEVANALFNAVETWAKQKGMNEVVGPLGFSDQEREGLLIEGFDELATFEEQYNYDYYQKLIENCGYQKEVDWVERQLRAPKQSDGRLERISSMMLEKYNLKVVTVKSVNKFLKLYGDAFFDIVEKTYAELYQTVPFTDRIKKQLIDSFKLVINPKFLIVIVDDNNKVVCFGFAIPSLSKAVQKSGGRLTLPTIFKILKAVRKPKVVDLAMVGVLPEYAMKGVSSALFAFMLNALKDNEVEYCETNLNLETNHKIQNQWKNFEGRLHKRRRSFKKSIYQKSVRKNAFYF